MSLQGIVTNIKKCFIQQKLSDIPQMCVTYVNFKKCPSHFFRVKVQYFFFTGGIAKELKLYDISIIQTVNQDQNEPFQAYRLKQHSFSKLRDVCDLQSWDRAIMAIEFQ